MQPAAEELLGRAIFYRNRRQLTQHEAGRGAHNHIASCDEALQLSEPLVRARLQRYQGCRRASLRRVPIVCYRNGRRLAHVS